MNDRPGWGTTRRGLIGHAALALVAAPAAVMALPVAAISGPYEANYVFTGNEPVPRMTIIDTRFPDAPPVWETCELPTCRSGGRLEQVIGRPAHFAWTGSCAQDANDWEPGPMATRVLAFLNANPESYPAV